jgi:5-hydroxyisourate hydrolase
VDLSIHVMDTAFGVPAADVHVGLQRTTMSGWIDVAEGRTGPDGRLTVWRGTSCVSATFRLELDLDRYYAALGSISVFPRAIVVFRVGDSDEDLRLSLLISPNLLVIYRGGVDEPA